ncbi:MAG: PilZ domain-containing protein [Vicinamibacterales bacterium]
MSSPLLEIAEALGALADERPSWSGYGTSGRVAVSERRAHVRFRPIDLPRPVLARLKYGPLLKLVDVSEGGALIETAARLNPGAQIVLEILAPGAPRTTTVPSRVTRCQISTLKGGLRYLGGLTFRHEIHFDDLTVDRPEPTVPREPVMVPEPIVVQEPVIPMADASALADAIGSIRSVASGARDRRVVRLLDEIVRQVQVCAAPRALMAFVEERLRRHVPLLAVAFGPRSRVQTASGESLAFELGHAETDDLQRMHVEFRPACRLDDSQMRLLHAGASVMSLIYTWHRALPEAR